MFVHLNPITGVLEPYAEEVQARLRASAVPNARVFLGNLCFQATVHLRADGNHFQTTPSFYNSRGGYKPHGYREVRLVGDDTAQLYITNTSDGWRFTSDPRKGRAVHANWVRDRVPTWQWCKTHSLSMRDADWLPYAAEVSARLEVERERALAERRNQFELALDVGVARKVVEVDLDNMFFVQRDVRTCARRWVRRVHAKSAPETDPEAPDDVCAICLASFAETPALPRTTLRCTHTFHAACLAPCTDTRCPLCRAVR
jgi:hypothetical protein